MISRKKYYLLIFLILPAILGIYLFYLPEQDKARADEVFELEKGISGLAILEETTLLPLGPITVEKETDSESLRRIRVIVTGYSSTEDQTDLDPFITAAGTIVRDGVVATNILPFGTKIKLPELFGDKIFVVEDRMNSRKGYHIDIWFPNREDALEFGAKITEVLILSS
ncbi:MAG: hypothetical protein QMC93_02645 [Patescibacteria group bacterium]|nr:hypothetical protein [Patescibacteria group bacterium]